MTPKTRLGSTLYKKAVLLLLLIVASTWAKPWSRGPSKFVSQQRGGQVFSKNPVKGIFHKNVGGKKLARKTSNQEVTKPLPYKSIGVSAVVISLVAGFAYHYREALKPLMDKSEIQRRTLKILKDLDEGNSSRGLLFYVLGMAGWEFLGLSTIPVETAAGMAFGLERGLLASGGGKLLGACLAFVLGRTVLSDFVRSKLAVNKTWSLVAGSVDVLSPMKVAFLMKFSCFPETIKNFGTSCLEIPFSKFFFATASHGFTFTLLWTSLGVDAAQRLENPEAPVNLALQASLIAAAAIGLVGSPLLMAWWIKEMKSRSNEVKIKK